MSIKTISYLEEKAELGTLNIVVPVDSEDLEKGRVLAQKLGDGWGEGISDDDLVHMASALSALSHAVPFGCYDFVQWAIEEGSGWDLHDAVREYAETQLGMVKVDAPIDSALGRKRSPMTTSPEETAELIFDSFDSGEARRIASAVIHFVEERERRTVH